MDVYEVTRGPRKGYYRRGTDEAISREEFDAAHSERVVDQKADDRSYINALRQAGSTGLLEAEEMFRETWGEDA